MTGIYFSKYKEFSCMATDCPMNCCKFYKISFFNWEVAQFGNRDDWKDIDGEGHDIRDFLEIDETGWFCKSCNGACIFFDLEKNLCSIQLNKGPLSMPSVCRTYPRIICRYQDRTEYFLDPCCPLAAHFIHNWTIGDLSVEGGDWIPSDDMAIGRDKILNLLSDSDNSLDYCLHVMKEQYGVEGEIPVVPLNGKKLDFTRRMTAYLTLAYLLPYDGIGIMENTMALILDIVKCYIEHVANLVFRDDWSMSLDFSSFLLDYVERVHFDVEIENRYIDSKDA